MAHLGGEPVSGVLAGLFPLLLLVWIHDILRIPLVNLLVLNAQHLLVEMNNPFTVHA